MDISDSRQIRAGAVDDHDDKPVGAESGEELLWEEACRREDAIRNLLHRHPDGLTRAAIDDAAWELGLSRASLSRLIRAFARAAL